MDDTDLTHLDMRKQQTLYETHNCFQENLINWGKLLIATSGTLKPVNCSFYLISFEWSGSKWRYKKHRTDEDLAIYIPKANGEFEPIEHLPVDSMVKTLGSMTCPSGKNKSAIERMQTQG